MEYEPDSGPEAQLKFEAHQKDLEERFKTFGEEVSWDKVPALVLAGRDVWSFGYDQNDPDNFTTISEDDLHWFKFGEAYVAEWAPFRVAPKVLTQEDEDAAANLIAELSAMGYIVSAIAPGQSYCEGETNEHWQDMGGECGNCGGKFIVNPSADAVKAEQS